MRVEKAVLFTVIGPFFRVVDWPTCPAHGFRRLPLPRPRALELLCVPGIRPSSLSASNERPMYEDGEERTRQVKRG